MALENALAGALSSAIQPSPRLSLDATLVDFAASAYLGGAVIGAFPFARLTDRLSRKRLLFGKLGISSSAKALSARAWHFATFTLLRFLQVAAAACRYQC